MEPHLRPASWMGNAALAALTLACVQADGEAPARRAIPAGAPAARTVPARVVTPVEPGQLINRPPRFLSVAPRIAREGDAYRYGFAARDPDGDEVMFTLLRAPEGAVLEGEVLKWTPTRAQAGHRQQFILRAADDRGGVRVQHWSVIPRREPAKGVLGGPKTRH